MADDRTVEAKLAVLPGIQRAAAAGEIPRSAVDQQVIDSLGNTGSTSYGVFGAVQDDSSIIDRMSPVLSHPFKVGFADSMSMVLLAGGVVVFLAFVILLLLPPIELRTTSASAAARAEQAEAAEQSETAGPPR